jgi:dTDP-4-amino-4,6-dideoxygalactose transaminase
LIEDCAHALFSRDANKDLGKYGDLSIFSLRKTLPVYEGGILLINNEKYRRIFKDIHEEGLPFRQSMKIWYRMLMQELLSVSDGSMDAPDFSEQFAKYKSSSISRWIANNSRKKTIEMARRTNYSIITEMLSGNRLLSPLFPNLPEGVVPWAYPCRDLKGVEFHSILRHSGIPCLTFGFDLDEKMENDIVYINPGKRIVLLPVHQGLKEEDVRNMVYDINKITANYY